MVSCIGSRGIKIKAVTLLTFGVLVILLTLFMTNKVYAVTLNPDPGETALPTYVRNSLENCSGVQSPHFEIWISAVGASGTTVVNVPYGTTSVNLQYNFSGVVCANNSAVPETRSRIDSASPAGQVSGIVGQVFTLNFSPFNELGRYSGASGTFTYSPPGGFTTSANHSVTINSQPINRFNSGTYLCVGGGNDAGGGFNYENCTPTPRSIEFRINVDPPPYNLNGYKVDVDASEAALPNGAGNVSLGTSSTTNNPYFFNFGNGSRTFSSDQIVRSGNNVWKRVGYRVCGYNFGSGFTNGCQNFSNSSITINTSMMRTDVTTTTRVLYRKITLESFNASCERVGVRARFPGGFTARLIVNGRDTNQTLNSSSLAAGVSQNLEFDVSKYRMFNAQDFQVRIRGLDTWQDGQSIAQGSVTTDVTVPSDGFDRGDDKRSCAEIIAANAYCAGQSGANGFVAGSDQFRVNIRIRGPALFNARLIVDDGEIGDNNIGARFGISPTNESPAGTYATGSIELFDISPWSDYGVRNFSARIRIQGSAYSWDPSDWSNHFNSTVGLTTDIGVGYTPIRFTPMPCAPPVCTLGAIPSAPESGQNFRVTFGYTYQPGVLGRDMEPQARFRITRSPEETSPTFLPAGSPIDIHNFPSSRNGASHTFGPYVIDSVGTYYMRGRLVVVSGGPNNINTTGWTCGGEISVSDIPYVSVYGNDVIAETINTYYNTEERTQNYANPAPVSGGSSVQFAAMAIRNINGFASAKMRDSDPRAIKGLTFANVGADTYGGNFGGTNRISPYYALIPTGMDPEDSGYILNGLGITPGDSQTIYVDGDAFITGDISYTEENEWTPSNIPQFRLIVRGNIYIGSGVTNLAGLYVAEKRDNNTGGNIITCSNPAGNGPMPINQIYTDCVQQLTINGSFIAHNKVILNRYGNSSLRYVRPDTEFPYTNNNIPCANNIQRGTCAAEVFNFSPEMYLGVPADTKPTSSTTQGKYDSIISLPPVL
jgi:hypothetical protein